MNRVRAGAPARARRAVDREIVVDLARGARRRLARLPRRRGGVERARRPLAELVRRSATTGSRRPGCSGRAPTATTRARRTCTRRPRPARRQGKFFPVEYQPPIEQPDSEYPLVLSTGRTLYHYNSATMTMREAGITDKQEDPFFEISAEDASRSAWPTATGRGSSRAAASSRRARTISDRVYPGLVWMALHFAQAKVNWLTHDVGDPLIGTPEYKVSAVRVEPLEGRRAPLPAWSRGLARGRRDRAAAASAASGSPTSTRSRCESTQLLLLDRPARGRRRRHGPPDRGAGPPG